MTAKIIKRIEKAPLWLLGFILEIIVFVPYDLMGKASVFTWHDQMDETILHYVLTARHLGEGLDIFPEMMGGLPASAFQPNAYLFVPLYKFFDPFVAFLLSYVIIFSMAFFGMYFLVKEYTNSAVLGLLSAGLFAMLPFYPVYGGAVAGVPMAALGITYLSKKKKPVLSYFLLTIFVLTSHLVLSGYALLGLWAVYLLYKLIKKNINVAEISGFVGMIILYVIINISLFKENLFGAGEAGHRIEFINHSTPFWQSLKEVFLGGSMHAESFHVYLIVPIVVLLVAGLIQNARKKLNDNQVKLLVISLIEFVTIILICLLFAFWNCEAVTAFKNSQTGILRNFQLDRFYWLLPAMWYSLFALSAAVHLSSESRFKFVCYIIVVLVLIPTAILVKNNSNLYMEINQKNNGSGVTGYITWEAYYSSNVYKEIDKAIGKPLDSYRVAHIGMSPAPALMYGFYTVDGYANSYPLSYKHKFREIMAEELALSPAAAEYFDTWGSRCYLYNSQSGTSYMNGKASEVKYEGLKYNYDLLKDMGCEYLFSCGEIVDANDENLEILGVFSNDTAYWKIWVYRLK
ncbi:MAG: hypothetical protein J5537_07765 [Lachnospiraceae bacterium]|nr:hypothetical protein [Lachnospiraceae bacterium]